MYYENRRIFRCALAGYFSTMTVALIGLGFVTAHAPSNRNNPGCAVSILMNSITDPYQPMAYPNMCFPQPVGRYVWLMWYLFDWKESIAVS
jgi:hypothetical protein